MGQLGFQVGWIPYLNLRPMHQELTRLTGQDLTLNMGHPTTVNRWLCDGTVALAPSSSINLLKSASLEMALPLGVASEGPVLSVYIGLHREHAEFYEFIQNRQTTLREQFQTSRLLHGTDWRKVSQSLLAQVEEYRPRNISLPRITFTPASAASTALTKVLLKLWFGSELAEQILVRSDESRTSGDFMNGGRAMELVIGDEALARRSEFCQVLDLGQKWWELTSLPFVFAVWQTTLNTLPEGIKSILFDAASLSSARMRVEPQVYYPDQMALDVHGNPLDLAAYWNVIQYKLTPRHLQGLLFYLTLYTTLFGLAPSSHVPMRLAKWTGQWPATF